jgi:hypothetical protein
MSYTIQTAILASRWTQDGIPQCFFTPAFLMRSAHCEL